MSADLRTRHRRLLAIGLYVLAGLCGVAAALRPSHGALQFLLWAAVGSAMTGWCVVDSRILGRPVIRTFYFLIFITWPLAVPIYLIWSRKWRGLAPMCVHGLGLFVLYVATANVAVHTAWQVTHRGYLALERQDYDRAASLMQWAVILKPNEPTSWYNLGVARAGTGDVSAAIAAVEKARSLDSTNPQYAKYLAELYRSGEPRKDQ